MPTKEVMHQVVKEALVAREATKLSIFFGEPIDVPSPPQAMWDTLAKARKKRIYVFSPHYLPHMTLNEGDSYPGWQQKPHEWFWQELAAGGLSPDAATLPGRWVLIDHLTRMKPSEPENVLRRDPFTNTVVSLIGGKSRNRRRIIDDQSDARLGLTSEELSEIIFPEISSLLSLNKELAEVRSPRAIEHNILGSLHHSVFGRAANSIWLEDIHISAGSHLISGNAMWGGLSGIDWRRPKSKYKQVGFRPMIVFTP